MPTCELFDPFDESLITFNMEYVAVFQYGLINSRIPVHVVDTIVAHSYEHAIQRANHLKETFVAKGGEIVGDIEVTYFEPEQLRIQGAADWVQFE